MSRLSPRAVRNQIGCLAVMALFTTMPLPAELAVDTAVDQRAVTAMQSFFSQRTLAHQYSATRRLEASGRGQQAWLDVQTDFTATSGLLYAVTAEGGSGFIRGRVLRSLLEEEKKLIARGATGGIALSRDNYAFTARGINDEGLAVVEMRPLRKERSLILGQMLLTLDGALRRVEGRLAKNPSFWVTRVNVVRTYQRINDVLMPVSLDTTAQLRLLGASALRMTYRYSHIDERPVDIGESEQPDYAASAGPQHLTREE